MAVVACGGNAIESVSEGKLVWTACEVGVQAFFGGGAGGGEQRFQRVHQGHQLLHFAHDPAMFGEAHLVVRCTCHDRG